ncbi:oxidoreductase [Crossiella cryophila]|uniref:NAD(P)-dependent dehydrogenase (Short-subunit alcohol dehydrogenase family) n=1 Tax=Crossiella cryophila TaxID=43355 RepID=A0A7W7FY18_9PSEU|nr:oxidoreductase [Crossiella cryophila]MBB4681620.1 NAD(P)-dependent dehydrogenase (short-subunit alcohol dehydrogenase family) [Crossiella cryophila]
MPKKNPTTWPVPTQHGRRALVTGANSGIGLETARALATAGATVILAGRDHTKLTTAAADIRTTTPNAKLQLLPLDLANLASIKDAAADLLTQGRPLDLLINNAGVMAVPDRRRTHDGFELTFGTNHLGHFALTGRLLPLLLAAPKPRVVTVSAAVARTPGTTLTDPNSEQTYRPMAAYTKSKYANVVFANELARRATKTPLTSVSVHPGTSMTGLQRHTPRLIQALANALLEPLLGQSPAEAALPSLYAATSPEVRPGQFFAPTGRRELRGTPGQVPLPPETTGQEVGHTLWSRSETLTQVHYDFPA